MEGLGGKTAKKKRALRKREPRGRERAEGVKKETIGDKTEPDERKTRPLVTRRIKGARGDHGGREGKGEEREGGGERPVEKLKAGDSAD